MKIKEVADMLNVSPRAIRFYEEKGLISPEKAEQNHYRIFCRADVERLKTIIALREIGMPLAVVKKALDELDKGESAVLIDFLQRQRKEMTDEWTRMKDMMHTTDQMIDSLKKEGSPLLDGIYERAAHLKGLKAQRSNWEDRWDFDGQAARYDEQVYRSVRDFNVHANYDEALDLTVEWIDPIGNESGLDIGIGTGNLAGRFHLARVNMHGVDQSAEMLKLCLGKSPQIPTKLGHFLALPYEDQRFDFVATSYALHHLHDDQKEIAVIEMERVLKPFGRLCITDLMFENQQDREQYLRHWTELGRDDIVRAIGDEFFADRSRLLRCLENRGFRTKVRKINEMLHAVFAEKTF